MYDKNCKWRKSCGLDFCHGEGVCPFFENGKAPKDTDDAKKYIIAYLKESEGDA